MTEPDALPRRAAEALRSAPEPGWDAISGRVVAALRAAGPAGWPLEASVPPGFSGEGALFVADTVLRGEISRAVRAAVGRTPTAVTCLFDDHTLRALAIDLTAPYGVALPELAHQARAAVAAVTRDLLGQAGAAALSAIDVTITDVVFEGEPPALP
jgi:hypothetical protein